MRRCDLLALAGAAALVRPEAARAQQRPTMPVIGFLGSATPGPWATRLRGFHEGLGESGFVKARMSPSSIAGRIRGSIDFRPWRQTLSSARSP